MDIIFNCPKCEQELAVDNSGAGSEIACPSCGEKIVIPQAPAAPRTPNLPPADGAHPLNPMASSAAAKIEMHLKVPVHSKPSESLIVKPLVPLDAAAAKEIDKKIRIKTIRHTDCIEVGHDRFDEMVSAILSKIGESNIISINSINYTILDIASQKLMTDYGLQVVYRG
jgi:DNA-directed RNA polymerase subunit RPC12/RpoP